MLLFFFKFLTVFISVLVYFETFLKTCALGSILFGALGALYQFRFRRFLAYSTISNLGFVFLGLFC